MSNINNKTTTFVTITNVLIILLVAFMCWHTNSALCLLGLFYLQNIPVFQTMEEDQDPDEGKAYQDSEIGFTSK